MFPSERDWVADPSLWQRILLALLGGPTLAVGVAFLAPAVWASIRGRVCLLCLWFGLPAATLGFVLAAAAVLPIGRRRESVLTVAMILFGCSLALFVIFSFKYGL